MKYYLLIISLAAIYSISGITGSASSDNSWDIDLPEILTAFVALWGAVLSTYNTYQQRKMNKPNIKVELQNDRLDKTVGFNEYGFEIPKAVPTIIFVAINKGQKIVTLDGFDLLLSDNGQINVDFQKGQLSYAQDHLTFPYELLPGKRVNYHVYIEDIAQALREMGYSGKVKLTGNFKDQIGKVYSSNSYCVDIENHPEIKP